MGKLQGTPVPTELHRKQGSATQPRHLRYWHAGVCLRTDSQVERVAWYGEAARQRVEVHDPDHASDRHLRVPALGPRYDGDICSEDIRASIEAVSLDGALKG